MSKDISINNLVKLFKKYNFSSNLLKTTSVDEIENGTVYKERFIINNIVENPSQIKIQGPKPLLYKNTFYDILNLENVDFSKTAFSNLYLKGRVKDGSTSYELMKNIDTSIGNILGSGFIKQIDEPKDYNIEDQLNSFQLSNELSETIKTLTKLLLQISGITDQSVNDEIVDTVYANRNRIFALLTILIAYITAESDGTVFLDDDKLATDKLENILSVVIVAFMDINALNGDNDFFYNELVLEEEYERYLESLEDDSIGIVVEEQNLQEIIVSEEQQENKTKDEPSDEPVEQQQSIDIKVEDEDEFEDAESDFEDAEEDDDDIDDIANEFGNIDLDDNDAFKQTPEEEAINKSRKIALETEGAKLQTYFTKLPVFGKAITDNKNSIEKMEGFLYDTFKDEYSKYNAYYENGLEIINFLSNLQEESILLSVGEKSKAMQLYNLQQKFAEKFNTEYVSKLNKMIYDVRNNSKKYQIDIRGESDDGFFQSGSYKKFNLSDVNKINLQDIPKAENIGDSNDNARVSIKPPTLKGGLANIPDRGVLGDILYKIDVENKEKEAESKRREAEMAKQAKIEQEQREKEKRDRENAEKQKKLKQQVKSERVSNSTNKTEQNRLFNNFSYKGTGNKDIVVLTPEQDKKYLEKLNSGLKNNITDILSYENTEQDVWAKLNATKLTYAFAQVFEKDINYQYFEQFSTVKEGVDSKVVHRKLRGLLKRSDLSGFKELSNDSFYDMEQFLDAFVRSSNIRRNNVNDSVETVKSSMDVMNTLFEIDRQNTKGIKNSIKNALLEDENVNVIALLNSLNNMQKQLVYNQVKEIDIFFLMHVIGPNGTLSKDGSKMREKYTKPMSFYAERIVFGV